MCYHKYMRIKWNTVTWYSKALALAVFIAVPVFAFWLGTELGGAQQYEKDMAADLNSVLFEPTTRVTRYVPEKISSEKMAAAKSGSCFANSLAAPYRDDAWRCTTGNAIQDPCLAIPGSANLLCSPHPEDAVNTSATVLSLTKPLPKPEGQLKTATPADGSWLIKLDNGATCTPFTGTLPFSDKGDIAKYGCTDKYLIFGITNSHTKSWKARIGMLGAATAGSPPRLINEKITPIAAVWQ